MSKRQRLGTVRIRLTDLATLITLTGKLRRKAEWYAGERVRLIEACEELQAKLRRQRERHAEQHTAFAVAMGEYDATLRQLTEERQQINHNLRTLRDNAMFTESFHRSLAPLYSFLPPDAPQEEGE